MKIEIKNENWKLRLKIKIEIQEWKSELKIENENWKVVTQNGEWDSVRKKPLSGESGQGTHGTGGKN